MALDVVVALVVVVTVEEVVVLFVAVVFDPLGMLSTGPGPSVPLPHAATLTPTKHKLPTLPKIVFMISPS